MVDDLLLEGGIGEVFLFVLVVGGVCCVVLFFGCGFQVYGVGKFVVEVFKCCCNVVGFVGVFLVGDWFVILVVVEVLYVGDEVIDWMLDEVVDGEIEVDDDGEENDKVVCNYQNGLFMDLCGNNGGWDIDEDDLVGVQVGQVEGIDEMFKLCVVFVGDVFELGGCFVGDGGFDFFRCYVIVVFYYVVGVRFDELFFVL